MAGDNAQRFARIFIDDSEHFVFMAVAQPVIDEVDTPDMVWVFRPQTNDGAVFVIQPFSFFVALRQLQAVFSPQPFDLFMVDLPAFNAQQLGNFVITVAPILLRQTN